MLVTKKRHDSDMQDVRNQIDTLNNKYRELWHKHEMLLRHFGLLEHTIPAVKELRTKGGPERDPKDA